MSVRPLLRLPSLRAEYMFVPLLERPMEGGGDGPPLLLGPTGNPFMLMFPLEPPEGGGEARLPRLLG